MRKRFLLLCCVALLAACKERGRTGETVVELKTSMGNIKILLYDDTPLHRDNFVKLVEEHAYDSLLFHRVIKGFMVQAGDPASRRATAGAHLGEHSVGEDIDAEIVPGRFHKRGAVAAARQGDSQNPGRRSSGSQFYIVQGEVFAPDVLEDVVRRVNESRRGEIQRSLGQVHGDEFRRLETANDPAAMDALTVRVNAECDSIFAVRRLVLTPEQANVYTTEGGAPHLDGAYTVFGEVVSGLEVIDRIADVQVDGANRPVQDVRVLSARVAR
jgi:peptidylprolyl isomerase/peptidyl-prolyl cis-trans isomerase B (cyclophilin B)